MADYLKSIGFHMFVKPDFHFLNQLPKPSGLNVSFNARESFALGWQVAERRALGNARLYLDHTLYQWGRWGDSSSGQSQIGMSLGS